MAKKRPDRIVESGLAMLKQWDVDDSASPSELEKHLGRAYEADAAIVYRLGMTASEESSRVLAAFSDGADKETGKRIKRALYRLKQNGIEAPRKVVRHFTPPEPKIEGYVSPFDGRGDRLMWLVKSRPGGLVHLFAVVNDPNGIADMEVNEISRKTLRAMLSDLAERNEIHMVAAPWQSVDWAIHRAAQWTRDRGAQRPRTNYSVVRSQITSEPVREDWPGVFDALDEDFSVQEADLGESADILSEPEMRTWLLGEDEIRLIMDELADVESSPLILNEAIKRERFDEISNRAVEDTFPPDQRPSWTRRMQAMAYYFAKTERPRRAGQCAAVARALSDSVSANSIPFCFTYVGRALALFLEMESAQVEEEDSGEPKLVLTPEEAMLQRRR